MKKLPKCGAGHSSATGSWGYLPQPPHRDEEDAVRLVSAGLIVPDPTYEQLPLVYFLGKSIKVQFESEDNPVEFMWVTVTGVDSAKLVGTLDNSPVVATHLKYGDTVRVSPTEVIMVYLTLAEWKAEVELLRSKDACSNPWLGAASGERFDSLHAAGLSPRQAVNWWREWQP